MNIYRRVLLMLMALNASHMMHAAPFLYVGNDDSSTVSVIDAAIDMVITTIPLSSDCNIGVAMTPDNSTVFVACIDMTVNRINVPTNTPLPSIPLMTTVPMDLAVTPDGLYVYVTCNDGTIRRITIATLGVDIIASGFSNPNAIVIAPNGLTAYVADATPSVTPIDIATNTLGTAVTGVPLAMPLDLAVDPSSTYLYVANFNGGNVLQFNISTNRLAPTLSNTIMVAAGLIVGVAITPDGDYLYATDANNPSQGSVFPINISNPTSPVVGTQVAMGIGIAPALIVAPQNSFAYIPNIGSGTVTPLNITNRAAPVAEPDITVGMKPGGIASTFIPAPSNVAGTMSTNIFLDKTELVLTITWTPNIANAMASPTAYNIYLGTTLVQTVSATCPPTTSVYVPCCNDQNNFFISTVYSDGTESMPVPVIVS